MRYFFILFIIVVLLFFIPSAFAKSSYVLPYPSFMPGSKIYTVHLWWEKILKYWYFGNFGQFDYSLTESDKYLVQAKILFEYNQYLLAFKALQESNNYFLEAPIYLKNAVAEHKDISQKETLFKEAALKHIEVLSLMLFQTPDNFVWNPEKSKPTILNIKDLINESISVRDKVL